MFRRVGRGEKRGKIVTKPVDSLACHLSVPLVYFQMPRCRHLVSLELLLDSFVLRVVE